MILQYRYQAPGGSSDMMEVRQERAIIRNLAASVIQTAWKVRAPAQVVPRCRLERTPPAYTSRCPAGSFPSEAMGVSTTKNASMKSHAPASLNSDRVLVGGAGDGVERSSFVEGWEERRDIQQPRPRRKYGSPRPRRRTAQRQSGSGTGSGTGSGEHDVAKTVLCSKDPTCSPAYASHGRDTIHPQSVSATHLRRSVRSRTMRKLAVSKCQHGAAASEVMSILWLRESEAVGIMDALGLPLNLSSEIDTRERRSKNTVRLPLLSSVGTLRGATSVPLAAGGLVAAEASKSKVAPEETLEAARSKQMATTLSEVAARLSLLPQSSLPIDPDRGRIALVHLAQLIFRSHRRVCVRKMLIQRGDRRVLTWDARQVIDFLLAAGVPKAPESRRLAPNSGIELIRQTLHVLSDEEDTSKEAGSASSSSSSSRLSHQAGARIQLGVTDLTRHGLLGVGTKPNVLRKRLLFHCVTLGLFAVWQETGVLPGEDAGGACSGKSGASRHTLCEALHRVILLQEKGRDQDENPPHEAPREKRHVQIVELGGVEPERHREKPCEKRASLDSNVRAASSTRPLLRVRRRGRSTVSGGKGDNERKPPLNTPLTGIRIPTGGLDSDWAGRPSSRHELRHEERTVAKPIRGALPTSASNIYDSDAEGRESGTARKIWRFPRSSSAAWLPAASWSSTPQHQRPIRPRNQRIEKNPLNPGVSTANIQPRGYRHPVPPSSSPALLGRISNNEDTIAASSLCTTKLYFGETPPPCGIRNAGHVAVGFARYFPQGSLPQPPWRPAGVCHSPPIVTDVAAQAKGRDGAGVATPRRDSTLPMKSMHRKSANLVHGKTGAPEPPKLESSGQERSTSESRRRKPHRYWDGSTWGRRRQRRGRCAWATANDRREAILDYEGISGSPVRSGVRTRSPSEDGKVDHRQHGFRSGEPPPMKHTVGIFTGQPLELGASFGSMKRPGGREGSRRVPQRLPFGTRHQRQRTTTPGDEPHRHTGEHLQGAPEKATDELTRLKATLKPVPRGVQPERRWKPTVEAAHGASPGANPWSRSTKSTRVGTPSDSPTPSGSEGDARRIDFPTDGIPVDSNGSDASRLSSGRQTEELVNLSLSDFEVEGVDTIPSRRRTKLFGAGREDVHVGAGQEYFPASSAEDANAWTARVKAGLCW